MQVETVIDQFRGKHFYLSNFYHHPIEWDRAVWAATIEHAFQAEKAASTSDALWVIESPTPKEAKRRGRRVKLRPDWEDVKVDVMRDLLSLKFPEYGALSYSLVRTGDAELVEANNWGDRFWGKVNGVGQNWLGRLLMERREVLRNGR